MAKRDQLLPLGWVEPDFMWALGYKDRTRKTPPRKAKSGGASLDHGLFGPLKCQLIFWQIPQS